MGNTASAQITANFEDIQNGITKKNGILIHVMDDESILISGTVKMTVETTKINELMTEHNYDINIIIYGKNVDDYETLAKKRTQLMSLGFRNVWFYPGGIFEWILLQSLIWKFIPLGNLLHLGKISKILGICVIKKAFMFIFRQIQYICI